MQNCSHTDEIKQLKQLKVEFLQQVELMKLNAKSLQSQLDHQREKAEVLSTQLTSHQIQEGDSDYDVKAENNQL